MTKTFYRYWPLCLVLLSLSFATGCVTKATHEATARQLDDTRRQLADAKNDDTTHASQCARDTEKLNREIAQVRADLAKEIDQEKAYAASMQASLDNATAENGQLRKELERLGKNVDKLLNEKGLLASALDEAKQRLEELRRAQAAATARAELFQQLVKKFQKMIDAGALQIVLRDGRMVLQLSNDVLFDSGHVELKPDGGVALKQIASVLKTLNDHRFQIAGHTDAIPIHTARYPSNWELSNSRALEVVHFLIAQGLAPQNLSAAGYGEFDPIAGNDTSIGRQKNRRTEISLQPNIAEFVAVPQNSETATHP